MCDNPSCTSERILSVDAKCSDLCMLEFNGVQRSDYVPGDIGISDSEDYINFQYCLECGKVQGRFPIEDPEFAS